MIVEKINKNIFITTLILFIAIFIFEFTNIDILVQNMFYNFDTQKWLFDKKEPILKLIFYDGIKIIITIFAISILLGLIFFKTKNIIKENKKALIIIFLSIVFVPLIISSLKAITNIPCPCNITNYNGNSPYIKIFDTYPSDFIQKSKAKCWPAGHSSGGFALLALIFLMKSKKTKFYATAFALITAWSMGLYKMVIGDHFLSHTVITMILAWLLILIIHKIVERIFIEKSTQI